jgi:hypothetical protein
VGRGKVRVTKPGTVTDLFLRKDVSMIPITYARTHTFEMTNIRTEYTDGVTKLTFQLEEVGKPASPEVRRYSRSSSLATASLFKEENSGMSISPRSAERSEGSTTLSELDSVIKN